MSRLTRSALRSHLAERVFSAPAMATLTPRRIGAEVELLALDAQTGRPCPVAAEGVPSSLPFLRRFAARQGWTEERTAKGAVSFVVRGGGVVSFEPGGQIEYASPPSRTLSGQVHRLRSVVVPLRAAAATEGIALLTAGIDPVNPVESVGLQLSSERYTRMAAHFARIGPSGARMMRQTAALQISLDFDDEPRLRWRLLNALSPFVTAIFASSAQYAGRNTGHKSFRAHCWRQLDPGRTGLPYDERSPIEAYLNFALGAPAILYPTVQERCRPFGEWLTLASPTIEEWEAHLGTLFPEVRPRGHLELRSADAVDPAWYPAPLALVAGLAYEPHALRAALELLPAPDLGLLERAGRLGLDDPTIARTAVDLCDLALGACAALGPRFVHPAHLDEARAYFDLYTRRGRSPAGDPASQAVAA
ncbi:MAG TPA: glutamate-cysteine ligase family protein [Gemmatimonadales bacterium]|nr:glutamate-cysteine ligase family protein [Gemmatimonadales bacterium]